MHNTTTTLIEWYRNGLSFNAILKCWGAWQRQGGDYLGYKSFYKDSKRETIWLKDNELLLVDRALGQLKAENKNLFEVLYRKFALRQTYKQIGKNLKVCFATVKQYEISGIDDVREILWQLLEETNSRV